jgi:hypothetical protein
MGADWANFIVRRRCIARIARRERQGIERSDQPTNQIPV